jgi:hypothetical protein
MKVLVVIGAIALLPMLAQQSQLPQPRKPGKWCPEGWSANGNYCVPGFDKARPASLLYAQSHRQAESVGHYAGWYRNCDYASRVSAA